jgi:hypothetical protein
MGEKGRHSALTPFAPVEPLAPLADTTGRAVLDGFDL